MKHQIFSFLSLSLLPFALACGSSSTSFEGKESTCEEFCEQIATCSSPGDVEESACQKTCVENQLVSRGGQEVITSCLTQQGCGTSNLPNTLGCLLDGLRDLPTSKEGETFCSTSIDKLASCGEDESPVDAKTCSDVVSAVADEFLVDLNQCFEDDFTCQSAQLCLLSAVMKNVDLDALQNESSGISGLLLLLGGDFDTDDLFDFDDDDAPDVEEGEAP